jgi:hypothetical protein
MGRVLAGVALLALCAGLVWLWSGSGRGASARTARMETSAGSSSTRKAELAPAVRPEEADAGERPQDAAQAEATLSPTVREELAQDESAPWEPLPTDLVVEVVDPNGSPCAGIQFFLAAAEVEEAEGLGNLETSDARGRAMFDGGREFVARASTALFLKTRLPFERLPSLELDASVLAAPVVRFVLPPGGSIEVFVRELDGTNAPDGSDLRLTLVAPEELHEPDLAGPQWSYAVHGGKCHIPWVELGRDWELAAWRPNGAEPTRLRTRGPVRLGERIERELVLGSDHPVVSFRVLRPDGSVLAQEEVELARATFFSSLEKSVITTDAEGRFTRDGQKTFFESGSFTVTHRLPSGEAWMGRAALPDGLAPGWNEGGDIRLEGEPLLVAGRVVDGRGAPVVDAYVAVGAEQRWAVTASGQSDALGNFELRGLWTEDTFQVHARAAGQRSQDVEARQGARDVVLVLTPRFVLSGELVLDPLVDPGVIRFAREERDGKRIELERKARRFVVSSSLGVSPSSPGHFELEPIEGGAFDFLCLLEDVELARLPGLVVRSDLDLGPIDLRGKVALCEIELLGDGDLSAITGEYSWWPSADGEHRQGSFQGPLVRILSPRAPLDIELRPRGYRSALLERVDGRRQHHLEAPLRVRLVLRTSGTVPPPPYRFDCELFQGGSNVSQPDGPRWFTPERNEIRCLVGSAGKLEVRWHLERKVEGDGFGGAIGSHVLEERWTSIEVLDVPGEQVFELSLDAAALEELVREPPF